jgi:hypothetical protein
MHMFISSYVRACVRACVTLASVHLPSCVLLWSVLHRSTEMSAETSAQGFGEILWGSTHLLAHGGGNKVGGEHVGVAKHLGLDVDDGQLLERGARLSVRKEMDRLEDCRHILAVRVVQKPLATRVGIPVVGKVVPLAFDPHRQDLFAPLAQHPLHCHRPPAHLLGSWIRCGDALQAANPAALSLDQSPPAREPSWHGNPAPPLQGGPA